MVVNMRNLSKEVQIVIFHSPKISSLRYMQKSSLLWKKESIIIWLLLSKRKTYISWWRGFELFDIQNIPPSQH